MENFNDSSLFSRRDLKKMKAKAPNSWKVSAFYLNEEEQIKRKDASFLSWAKRIKRNQKVGRTIHQKKLEQNFQKWEQKRMKDEIDKINFYIEVLKLNQKEAEQRVANEKDLIEKNLSKRRIKQKKIYNKIYKQ